MNPKSIVDEFYKLESAYRPHGVWHARMKPGDFYSIDCDGKAWFIWPDEVIEKLNSGAKVFQHGDGDNRYEVTLKV